MKPSSLGSRVAETSAETTKGNMINAIIVDLDAEIGPSLPGCGVVSEHELRLEFGLYATPSEIQEALKQQCDFDVRATPTEGNPCKKGSYWDFREITTSVTDHRVFYAYHRSRRYYIILRTEE